MARSRWMHGIEFLPLRLAVGLADALPLPVALGCGRRLGAMSWHVLRRRRRTAVQNVLRAGLAWDRAEAVRIARASFESFGMLAVESLAASRLITPETLDQHVEMEIPEATRRLLEDPSAGLIFVNQHLGNWEISAHIASFFKKLVAVARKMNNPYAQAFMLRRNPRRNVEVVGKHASDRLALLRPLRQGAMLGLVCDQHASSHGITVDFFGHPARTVTSPARLHLATQCPIVCVCCIRTGPMRFRLIASEPLRFPSTGDRDADVRRITMEMNRRIEAHIRLAPEQYLWAHRRWR